MSSVFEEKITKVYNALMNRINASIGTHNTSSTSHSDIRNTNIHFGQVDNTSTSTVFTATVPNLTALVDGTTVMLKNGVVTSDTGFTINVNGLGAKPVYSNLASATQDSTIFNINYTMLFVYDSTRISGGCWICYRGYDSNTNTIGYQLRTNSTPYTATDKGYRYRLWLETDDNKYMPVNTSTSTNATANRSSSMNTREFWIGGNILYNSTNGTTNANATMSATSLWKQYTLALGYSFNNTGSALVMNYPSPVYMVAEATSNGKARLHTPYYTQTLPSTEDGLLYIYLGHMYSETSLELALDHPVYEYKNDGIRLYQETYTIDEVDDLLDGKSDTNHNHTKSQITDFPSLSTVATSGSYNDLSNKPSIPTKTSDLTNDSGYLTSHQDISGKANVSDLGDVAFSNDYADLDNIPSTFSPSTHTHDDRYYTETEIDTALNGKQATLVSGTNIKTINSQSLLGTGDITVGDDVGSFTDLQALINNASSGDIIILDKDYQYNNDNDSANLAINKSLTIHGNGHIIDADSKVPILVLNGSNITVTINETTFINGRASGSIAGGAISGSSLSGDSILSLNHCIFIKNQNVTTLGGALFIKTGVINHCIFIENTSKRNGGAIYCNDNSSVVKNCIFKDNIAQNSNGNDIYCNGNNLIIYNCDTVSANLYNTINKPYLTDHQDITGKANTSDLGNLAYEDDVDLSTHDVSELTDTNDTAFTPKSHTHGNLQNNGQVGTSNNASKNVVTDSNGYITTEAKPIIDTTITSGGSNAVTSGAIYSALQNKQNNLSSLNFQSDIYSNDIFYDDGLVFFSTNNRIYHDYVDTNELHFFDSNDNDVNFDDISLNGHNHSISDVTSLQTTLNGKINTSDIASNLTTSINGKVLDASQGKWLNDNKASSTHTHGNINNDGTITTVKTIDSNANVGADYFIIRDNNDSNSTKSANVLDVLNKIVLDLIDEG